MSADAIVGAADTAEAVPYEFGLPRQLTDEKAALYREAAQQVALDAETAIGQWVSGCSVEADPIAEIDAGTALVPAEESYDLVPLTVAGASCGTLAIEQELALALISGTLGGPARADVVARPLTSIEARVLDLITSAVVDAASRTLLLTGVEIQRGRGDGFRAGDDDKPKDLIAFSLGIEGAGERGSILLAFDSNTLQRFSDAVDRRLGGGRDVVPIQPSPLAALALNPVPLHLAVEVGRARLTAREVVELRRGDVIRTRVPVSADLVASAGDTDLFEVRLGQRGSKLVAEIVSPIVTEADG